MRAPSTLFASLVLPAVLALACSSNSDATDGDGSGNGASNGSGAANGDPSVIGNLGGAGVGAGSTSGNGDPEVCDGKDNDGNGIADDVDVGGDGVCDCLKVATLGRAGRHGGGDVFSEWLDARSTNGAVNLDDQVLTAELLAPFQVIVVQNVNPDDEANPDGNQYGIGRDYSAAEIEALNDWVKGGGGLMTLIGYAGSSERGNVNRLLEDTGLSYDSDAVLPKSGGRSLAVDDFWSEDHPIADGITAVGVDNGYEVRGEGDLIAEEDDIAVGKAKAHGDGKVFVFGDEWITYDSEWENYIDEYQLERFWLNSLKWLTPAQECQVPIPPTIR